MEKGPKPPSTPSGGGVQKSQFLAANQAWDTTRKNQPTSWKKSGGCKDPNYKKNKRGEKKLLVFFFCNNGPEKGKGFKGGIRKKETNSNGGKNGKNTSGGGKPWEPERTKKPPLCFGRKRKTGERTPWGFQTPNFTLLGCFNFTFLLPTKKVKKRGGTLK